MATQSRFQTDSIGRTSTKTMFGVSHKHHGAAKWGGWEVENTRDAWLGRFMKLVWKIHEVARCKSPLPWDWGVPHILEES